MYFYLLIIIVIIIIYYYYYYYFITRLACLFFYTRTIKVLISESFLDVFLSSFQFHSYNTSSGKYLRSQFSRT